MKLLFLDNLAPFPVNNGGAIRSWNFIKAFTSENKISFLCFGTLKDYVVPVELKRYFKNIWFVKYKVKKEVEFPKF